jgi:D-threo-aldose 1-dehydrogenase
MQLNEIGTTGVKIPPIIFGTSALGNLYTALTDDVKLEIVKQAIDHVPSPVVFDSAGKYGAGLALEKLGECLDKLNIAPENVIISNKLGWKRTPLLTAEPTFEQGVWMDLKHDAVQDISYEGILTCYEQGNQLLGGKYFPQLASVHDPDEYLNAATSAKNREMRFGQIVEAYRALADLKKSGKVKAVGVGAKNWKVIAEISKEVELDWVMFANSMTIMHHPKDLLDFMQSLHQNQVSIVNSAVFHAGFLIGGKYFDYQLIQPDTAANKAIFAWRDQFFALCAKHQISPAVACVSFATTAPGVVSIALNTSNPKHIRGNVESVTTQVPVAFWADMKANKLIAEDYPFL